ncbi:hypothetical protein T1E_1520 [Pseudomonas putida DOT-T1E]|uniref:Uncharacterized protein n=1 Tax=Pseudomonas putida (strain DOT-T1E) TaxID=1196325 RepID=I7AXF4_PSEPT|nr:hypothetical protein T1E_1520 [Pseudomonas putida DOT-T1E]
MQLISLTGVLPASASSRACPLRKPEGKGNACTVARRSGFTREEAGPAGQSPPAIHRCRRHRIRG